MTTADYWAYAIPDTMRGVPHFGLARRLREGVGLVFRLIDRQRQRRALLELDRHLLDDIGISARQALEEGHKPFWR